MDIEILSTEFAICKTKSIDNMDFNSQFLFIGKTDEEISVVCCIDNIPSDTYEKDMGWRAFRIKGVLDFSLTGILYKITEIMAKEKIGIFAVSTYNTDYVLVKKENIERAAESLSNNGYNVSYLYDK